MTHGVAKLVTRSMALRFQESFNLFLVLNYLDVDGKV